MASYNAYTSLKAFDTKSMCIQLQRDRKRKRILHRGPSCSCAVLAAAFEKGWSNCNNYHEFMARQHSFMKAAREGSTSAQGYLKAVRENAKREDAKK